MRRIVTLVFRANLVALAALSLLACDDGDPDLDALDGAALADAAAIDVDGAAPVVDMFPDLGAFPDVGARDFGSAPDADEADADETDTGALDGLLDAEPVAEPDMAVEPPARPYAGPLIRPTPAPPSRYAPDSEGCHWLYRQEHVPSFHLTISDIAWRQLEFDREHGPARDILDEDETPYHRLDAIEYDGHIVRNARIRLRGNPNFWAGQGKMQFQISFDEDNEFGHFLGLRKLAFDAAQFNRSFLRDRLALSVARAAGLPAPCANNARLYVNGAYYGLYTNVEKLDEVFLWRRMVEPTGDLYKRSGWDLRSNRDRPVVYERRLDALRAVDSYSALSAWLHVPLSAKVYAFEAMLPAPDGHWAGGFNGYYYDDPHTGRFVLLPWDFDGAFDQEAPTIDPLTWRKPERFHGRPIYDLIVGDPEGERIYVDALEEVLDRAYDPEVLGARIDRWQAQIHDAAVEDPNKPFDMQLHRERTDVLRAGIHTRAAYVRAWIECHRAGGVYEAGVGCL